MYKKGFEVLGEIIVVVILLLIIFIILLKVIGGILPK